MAEQAKELKIPFDNNPGFEVENPKPINPLINFLETPIPNKSINLNPTPLEGHKPWDPGRGFSRLTGSLTPRDSMAGKRARIFGEKG